MNILATFSSDAPRCLCMPSICHLSAIWFGPRRQAANNEPNLGGVTSIISSLLMFAHEEKSANPSSAMCGDLGICILFIEYIHTLPLLVRVRVMYLQ